MDQNKTFIRLGNELIYFGKNDDHEMYLFDPHINSILLTLNVIKFQQKKFVLVF